MRASLCAVATMPSGLPSRALTPFGRPAGCAGAQSVSLRSAHPPGEVAQCAFAFGRGFRGHAKGGGDAAGDAPGFGFEHAASADSIIRAQAQPGAEAPGVGEVLLEVLRPAEFAEAHGDGLRADARNGAEVHAVNAPGLFV